MAETGRRDDPFTDFAEAYLGDMPRDTQIEIVADMFNLALHVGDTLMKQTCTILDTSFGLQLELPKQIDLIDDIAQTALARLGQTYLQTGSFWVDGLQDCVARDHGRGV